MLTINCVINITSHFIFRNGFNILLYGLGSKRVLLDQFRSSKLSANVQVVVNGFFPSLTLKNVSDLTIILLPLFYHKYNHVVLCCLQRGPGSNFYGCS